MLTVLTLLKVHPSPNGAQHGERPFWREFGPRYLEAWLKGVERFVPGPKHIRVMTDAPEMVRSAECVMLDQDVNAPGFWAKLNMFRSGVSNGRTLYCDLDNVINGPLDELCALTPDPLIMLDDRRVPGLPNGSAILFEAEKCRELWSQYAEVPRFMERRYVAVGDDYTMAYDQAYIWQWLESYWGARPFMQDMLPEGYILNARSELPNAADWRSARLIFGGGAEGKPHLSKHPGFALR